MIRRIRKKHLVALLALVALVAGVATSAAIMSSHSESNVANAEVLTVSIHGGGSIGGNDTVYFNGVQYKADTGNPKGDLNGKDWKDKVIAYLIAEKKRQLGGKGDFKCQDGYVWYAYDPTTKKPLVLMQNPLIDAGVYKNGNWKANNYTPGGGGKYDNAWRSYVDNELKPHYYNDSEGNTYLNGTREGWLAGCLMVSAATWGIYETTIDLYDVASRATVKVKSFEPCYIQYDNAAIGTDGYPKMGNGGKGYSYTKEDKPSAGHLAEGGNVVVTPYGELLNSLDSEYFKKADSAAEMNINYDELAKKVATACEETKNMRTSMTIPTDSDLSKSVAKGGIEKIMLTGKKRSISYPTADTEWYWRTSTIKVYHYVDCKGQTSQTIEGQHVVCRRGSVTPRVVNGPWTNGKWQRGNPPKKYTKKQLANYYCYDPSKPNDDFKIAPNPNPKSEKEYKSACWDHVKGQTTVSYGKESFVPIWHQYLLNILCNKTDYENYKKHFGEFGFAAGATYRELPISVSHRFQASMQSPVYYDNGKSSGVIGVFPRVAQLLAKNNELPGWHDKGTDDHSVSKLYAHGYNAENDPVYSKECPFDCVPDNASNKATQGNVGNGTSDKWNPALQRQGVKVTPSDTEGNPQKDSKVSADMTFFRNNAWNYFRVDAWVPTNEETITYGGSNAKRTIVTRNADATPWKSDGTGASLQGSQNGKDYGDVLNPGMRADGDSIGTQTSPSAAKVGTYGNSSGTSDGPITAVLNGQVNDFRIRAPWASDARMPIRLKVRYEYDVQNTAWVFAGPRSAGTNAVDDGSLHINKVTATSDGKCDATFTGAYENTDDKNYQFTGAGTPDDIDMKMDDLDKSLRVVGIQFARATAE